MNKEEIKRAVRHAYGKLAKEGKPCCDVSSCCGAPEMAEHISRSIGYGEEELKTFPEGANLGLGCGNPVALASLQEGEIVVDLGSGAGIDTFLAAQRVGETGRVIGVDMTPEMIDKARANAQKGNYANVEFRLGEIEDLPIPDDSADVVISNCVINLVPDKEKAFKEAFRVLKSGGRIMISDIVLLRELPDFVRNSVEAYVGCLSGAIMKGDYLEAMRQAGFQDVRTVDETRFPIDLMVNDPTAAAISEELKVTGEEMSGIADSVVSVKVRGVKPTDKR